ncbi:MAG: hypothetical protein FWG47_08310 [Propionibacteriaceae bacterium]|nr:hypothetical protein [Propionibacteriaceae bacterium]
MARYKMPQLNLHHLWIVIHAFLFGHPASRSETATRFRIQRARHIALKDYAGFPQVLIYPWDSGQQRDGVRMARVSKYGVGFGHFNDLAKIHDGDTVGNMPHYAQVMGNKQIRYAELFLQILSLSTD